MRKPDFTTYIKKYANVCNRHFGPPDLVCEEEGLHSRRRKVKFNAIPSLLLPNNPETIEGQRLFSASDCVVRKESKTIKEGVKSTLNDAMVAIPKIHKLIEVNLTFVSALETINEEENVSHSSEITDSSKQNRYLPTTRNLNPEVSPEDQTGHAILQDWVELTKSVMALLDREERGFFVTARETLLPHITSLMQLLGNVESPQYENEDIREKSVLTTPKKKRPRDEQNSPLPKKVKRLSDELPQNSTGGKLGMGERVEMEGTEQFPSSKKKMILSQVRYTPRKKRFRQIIKNQEKMISRCRARYCVIKAKLKELSETGKKKRILDVANTHLSGLTLRMIQSEIRREKKTSTIHRR